MPDLPPISVELKGKIADLMAKIALVKKEIASIDSPTLRIDTRKMADSMAKDLRSAAIRDAIKKSMDDTGVKAGDSFWTGFRRSWKAGLKKENAEGGFWGNLAKWGLPLAPAVMPAISGLSGIIGGLGTAGIGAAAGLGALKLAATEVLTPVQRAFQALDQYSSASGKTGANLIQANAQALRIWSQSAATGTAGGKSPAALRALVATEQLRIASNQAKLANARTPGSAAGYRATIGIEQNILKGYQAQLGIGSRTAPRNALPKNLQFLMNPNINWYTMTPAQRNALVVAAQKTTGLPNSAKSQIAALMNERQAYTGLNAPQRQALFQTQQFDTKLSGAETAAQPAVLGLYGKVLSALGPALKYITPLANTAAKALMPLITEIGKGIRTTAFSNFILLLERMAKLGIHGFGQALINIGIGFAHIFSGFAHSGIPHQVIQDLLEMTAHFKNWTGGAGFAAFMSGLKSTTPVVSDLLKNLQQILAKILGSMATGIGVWELKGLDALAATLNWIVHIPGLGHVIGNLLALQLVLSRFGIVKVESFVFSFLLKKILLLLPGIELVDGKITGMGALWKKVWGNITGWVSSAAKAVWGSIVSMGKALWTNLVAATKWAAGMVARMATAVAAWVAGLLGIDSATAASATFIIGATGGIILILAAVAVGIYELYKHWNTVWAWIKRIAKDAWNFIYNGVGKWLLPVLGPVGLIALGVIELAKHWKTVWGAISGAALDAWHHLHNDVFVPLIHIWDDVASGLKSFWNFVSGLLKRLEMLFAGWAKTILHYVSDAFSWIPNFVPGASALKSGLKSAEQDLQNFVSNTQGQLNKLTNSPHNVKIKFAIGGSAAAEAGGGKIIHAFAGGTRGAAPGWAWVGERGPELVHMRGGETVIPNHRIGGYASGTDLSFSASVPSSAAVGNLFAALDRIGNTIATRIASIISKHIAASGGAGGSGSPGFGVSPSGPVQQYARRLLAAYGWANQWGYFNDIVMRESGWNPFATNPSSGAYGIPQALPAGKMASAGSDWRTNPFTQIRWMMGYLRSRWGSPFNADMNEIRNHWYGAGGTILPGQWGIVGERGVPEIVSAGAHGATVTPMSGGHTGGQRPILIQIYTQEINPAKHAAQLGFELARRSA